MAKDTTESAKDVKNVTRPNFIGIGAQRSASTWIYRCLREHPEVFVSDSKELNFFSHSFDKGLDWYWENFAAGLQAKAIGEISPSYLVDPEAPERIHSVLGPTRILMLVRNPVDRARSAYKLFRELRYQDKAFEEVCVAGCDLVNQGLYAYHLGRYLEYFPREQVKVLLYDDIERDPKSVVKQVYDFLGVDSSYEPKALMVRYNQLIYDGAQKRLESFGLSWLVKLIKDSPLGPQIKKWKAHRDRRRLQQQAGRRDGELRALFREDILALQGLIDRDLSAWL